MPIPRRLEITEEDLARLEQAADTLARKNPELAALAKTPDPAVQFRQRVRTIATGVALGLIVFTALCVILVVIFAVLAGLFARVFHLVA